MCVRVCVCVSVCSRVQWNLSRLRCTGLRHIFSVHMESLQQSITKLSTLLSTGMITEGEFTNKRQQLMDAFVGMPSGATSSAPKHDRFVLPKQVTGSGPARTPKPAYVTGAARMNPYQRPDKWPKAADETWGQNPTTGGKGGWGNEWSGALSGKGQKGYAPNPWGQSGKGGGQWGKGGGQSWGSGGQSWGKGGGQMGSWGKGQGLRKERRTITEEEKAGSSTIKCQPVMDNVTVAQLRELFQVYGEIESAVINEGKPRFSYVNFTSPESATLAADAGNFELGGQTCKVTLTKRRPQASMEGKPCKVLAFRNLPTQVASAAIVSALETILVIHPGFERVSMAQPKDGGLSVYAFAYFATVDNALYARNALDGVDFYNQPLEAKFSNKASHQ